MHFLKFGDKKLNEFVRRFEIIINYTKHLSGNDK